MIHDFQEHFSVFRDRAPVTGPWKFTPGQSRRFACYVFSAASSSQNQTETEQTNSTAGASSPSIGLTGSNSAQVNTGTTVTLNGPGSTLQNLDPQVANSAFAAIVQTVQDALGSVTQAVQSTVSQNQEADESQNALVGSVLAQDQATAANTASGGQTNNNNTIITITIAAIIGFVIWVIWGRK